MAGMKFSMEADALTVHTKHGESNNGDLRTLVKKLLAAAEPVSNTFNGPAKAAFNTLKMNADSVADQLHNAHTGLMNSANDQNVALTTAANDAADLHSQTTSGLDFTAAVAKNVS